MLRSVPLAFASLVLALPAAASGGTITGTVTWSHPTPPRPALVAKDRLVCGLEGPKYERKIAVDARGRVAQAVVSIEGLPSQEVPRKAGADPRSGLKPQPVLFDQRACEYVPHVAATTRGSVVRFRSSDPIMHNVHLTDEKGKTVANYAMPVMDQEVAFKVQTVGELSLRCEAGHTWMRGFLKVFDHPFFSVSSELGRFEIRNVPPGEHRIVAWHPDLGRVEKTVVVPEDPKAVASIDLSF